MTDPLLQTELIGIGVIGLLGAAWHFIFDWCGRWPPLGVILPVNESPFEHLKLAFWPSIIYAAASYGTVAGHTGNFIVAKAAGLYVMPLVILALFYAYTACLSSGTGSAAVHILIFVVGVAAGQMASYAIMRAASLPGWLTWAALILAAVMAAAYALSPYRPPHRGLFHDDDGYYGIRRS
jgi:hypothetical protein